MQGVDPTGVEAGLAQLGAVLEELLVPGQQGWRQRGGVSTGGGICPGWTKALVCTPGWVPALPMGTQG